MKFGKFKVWFDFGKLKFVFALIRNQFGFIVCLLYYFMLHHFIHVCYCFEFTACVEE